MKYELEYGLKYTWTRLFIGMLSIGGPILGFFLMGWFGVIVGLVLVEFTYRVWPKWAFDYPAENLTYTLQVFREHAIKNGFIFCEWNKGKMAGFWIPTGRPAHDKHPYNPKTSAKDRLKGNEIRLMFRREDWEHVHGKDIWEELRKDFATAYHTWEIRDQKWIGFFKDDAEDQIQMLRRVTHTNRIPYIRAQIPLPPEQIYASIDENGDRIDGLPDMRKSEFYWKQRKHREKMAAKLQRKRDEQRQIDQNRREAEAMQKKRPKR